MASGTVVVVIDTGVPAATTVIERPWVSVWGVPVVESVTVTVKGEVPAVVGVPEIPPVEGSRVKPAGRVPVVTAQV